MLYIMQSAGIRKRKIKNRTAKQAPYNSKHRHLLLSSHFYFLFCFGLVDLQFRILCWLHLQNVINKLFFLFLLFWVSVDIFTRYKNKKKKMRDFFFNTLFFFCSKIYLFISLFIRFLFC